MAGIDNVDDAAVRNAIKADASLGKHRAHRHLPNWKRTKALSGKDWPLAGKGIQLASAPLGPEELWKLCLECVVDLFDGLGIDPPTEEELLRSRMDEEDFKANQDAIRTQFKAGGQTF